MAFLVGFLSSLLICFSLILFTFSVKSHSQSPIMFLTSPSPYCLHLSHMHTDICFVHTQARIEIYLASFDFLPLTNFHPLSCLPPSHHPPPTSILPPLCDGERLRRHTRRQPVIENSVEQSVFSPCLFLSHFLSSSPSSSPSGVSLCLVASAGLCLIPHHNALWWLCQRSSWSQRNSLQATSWDQ